MTKIASAAAGFGVSSAAGPLVMLLGMLLFALNDAMGKWLVSSYGLGQVILIRSVAALIILSPLLWKVGLAPIVNAERKGMQLARVLFSTGEVFCFYYAVMYLPLADVMTFWLAAPIYVAALSPFLLGERVGWRRWTAIAIGFVGVIIALEPSSAMFTLPAIISIIGSAAFAFMMISGRFLRGTPDTTLVLFQTGAAGVAGLIFAPFDWSPIQSQTDLLLLGLLGVVAMSAHMLVNRALKMSDAATVAPLQYTLLLYAVIFGWMFFGDVPRLTMMAGAALIIASGLFIFVREQMLKKKQDRPMEVP
ncbi:DMT family transporter [Pseudorhizobium flavum]|uniref:Drug/metabolite transporter (DMT)-like permease n=1 Tax=Pseudorhizobium flavum TaxID=1335061 RepID=A0A7W9Z0F4_9HYPH|nr:DMT family transporter [Pseudorhizobium flavum]MBB6181304.1 drug/metabolite transporter (DMT)-like permease [Pseudorhizobium flavum]CAD6618253.1 EamA/RhaT family transporter [Pseudorhizobium flavum]